MSKLKYGKLDHELLQISLPVYSNRVSSPDRNSVFYANKQSGRALARIFLHTSPEQLDAIS